MGYIRHHAIVVAGRHDWPEDWDPRPPSIHDARQVAVDLGCKVVTPVAGPGVNGTSSFLVGPDGSKEGWKDSDEGDAARDRFIAWLRTQDYYYDWAEVVLGSDEEAHVERHCWDDARED